MKLELIRTVFTEDTTLGELYVDGEFQCHILEDKDRGLTSDMPLKEIKKLKVKHETCIPYGTYPIKLTHSPKFKRVLPLLVGVPGYSGIRIHTGVRNTHTSGCLLPGEYTIGKEKELTNSKERFNALFKKLLNSKESINITISKI